MSVIHVTGTGGAITTERAPFFGHRIPEETRRALKYMSTLGRPAFRNILTATVHILEGRPVDHAKISALAVEGLNEESVRVMITGLHCLMKLALRLSVTSLKVEMFAEDLAELKFQKEFVADMSSAVYGHKGSVLQKQLSCTAPRFPRIVSVKWRIDVAISTSVLNRVLQPTILLELIMDNGKLHCFEMSVAKFHEFRFSVASVLRDMELLEKRSILKIND